MNTTVSNPARFADQSIVPFKEDERIRLIHATISNARHIKSASGKSTSALLGIIDAGAIMMFTIGKDKYEIVLPDNEAPNGEYRVPLSDTGLNILPINTLGLLWSTTQDEFNRIGTKRFTGVEPADDSSPLPSTDPDDPMPFDDPFNEGTVPMPAFLTKKN